MKFIRKIGEAIGAFFSDSNSVNEHTVMGVFYSGVLTFALFTEHVTEPKFYVLAVLTAACFGLSSFKK